MILLVGDEPVVWKIEFAVRLVKTKGEGYVVQKGLAKVLADQGAYDEASVAAYQRADS